jgi:hypothetical protein
LLRLYVRLLCRAYDNAKSEAHAVAVARVVVVDVAVVVDIAEVVAVASVGRAQPPVVGGSHGDTCGI